MSELGPQGTERSQAGQKESDGSDVDESFAARRQALIIASQTPEADQPAKSTLDFPAMSLDLKATFGFRQADRLVIDENPFLLGVALWLGDNLGLPAKVGLDPVDQWSRIATIGEQVRQTWKTALQILQEQRRSTTVN